MTDSQQSKWTDMSSTRKACVIAAAVLQISLAVWAWADLARRPKSQVRGRKAWWASIIGINYVGPLAYFGWGRLKDDSSDDHSV
jgi:hypothetical protein